MSDRDLSDLHPDLQPLAEQFLNMCHEQGIDAFITDTYRCEVDQNKDFAIGRDANGKVINPKAIITNARYGQSPHNCTLDDGAPGAKAFDFAIQDATGILDWDANDPEWQAAIKIGESIGLVSGSTFHSPIDSPHFELPNWRA